MNTGCTLCTGTVDDRETGKMYIVQRVIEMYSGHFTVDYREMYIAHCTVDYRETGAG